MHQCVRKVFRCTNLLRNRTWNWNSQRSDRVLLARCRQIPLHWDEKSFKSRGQIIGETEILLEDGTDIQELPLIVRKYTDAHLYESSAKSDTSQSYKKYKKKVYSAQEEEVREMIEGFGKCSSQRSVTALLDLIPPAEITPSVALQAIKTLVKLEDTEEFSKNFELSIDDELDTCTKMALISNLIDILVTSDVNSEILDALKIICEEIPGENTFGLRQKLCNEILIRISDDKFSILEICRSAQLLLMSDSQADIDKLWVGVIERQNDINENNIMGVFRILLHVNQSRPLIIKILQRHLEPITLKLKAENIAEILTILSEIKEYPYHIVQCLSNWLLTKILKLNEEKLGAIIAAFMLLPNLEDDVLRALEKFMIVRKLRIKNPGLVGIIMEYCNKYKARSSIIFNYCSDYLVKNAKRMNPSVLKSIFLPFGNLNCCPTNESTFWKVLEEELMEKFVQLNTEEILDIMLSFVFLEKYPVKFASKIFNSYFLNRMQSLKGTLWLDSLKTKLQLIDTALTLECKGYRGPLLFPDLSFSSIKQDSRIERMCEILLDILPSILGPDKRVASSVVLKNLPLTELYIVDIIIHPKGKSSLYNPNLRGKDFTALLIHLPEHYDSNGQFLIGLQVMRKRHLKCIGLNVVDLDYNTINSMLPHKAEVMRYLKNELSSPEQALPS